VYNSIIACQVMSYDARNEQRSKERITHIRRKAERRFKYQQLQAQYFENRYAQHEEALRERACPYQEEYGGCCHPCEYEYHLYLAKRMEERVWYKRRFGYYEKPSLLQRKRRRMSFMRNGWQSLRLPITLVAQFYRTGENAAGE
jgi:hypothetical protein